MTRHIVSYTNVGWDVSLGGTGQRISSMAYESALELAPGRPFTGVLEFAGSPNITSGRTLTVIEPDPLFRKGAHLELELGVPVR